MHITTGELIRRVRVSAGLTQAELGELIRFSQPAVSLLERGGAASHDVRTLRLVARALKVPLAILVVESDEEADMNRRNFLRAGAIGAGVAAGAGGAASASASGGIRVGSADVAAIAESANEIHELDLIVGGDRLCRVAANEVRSVDRLLNTARYSDVVGRSLTSAAAEIMTAAGWVHFDAGRMDEARRYYADAAQAAASVDDGIAVAHALGNASAMLAEWQCGRPVSVQQGVQYAQSASRAARRSGGPKLRALMAIREADALGMQNPALNRSAIADALARAHRAFGSSSGLDPAWVYLPEAGLCGMTGLMHMYLGEHKSASEQLRAAIAGTAAWPREQAEWYIQLGRNLVTSGDIAQGCEVLVDHADSIKQIGSTRVQQKLDFVAAQVRPHKDVPEVGRFLALQR